VQIEGTAISATSERGGGFSVTAPAGSQVLVVSYAGLDTARVPVRVEAGRKVSVDIALASEVYQLQAYTVSGFLEGQALAEEMQRQAMNPKVVVTTDTFGNADALPQEMLMRLPGMSGPGGAGS